MNLRKLLLCSLPIILALGTLATGCQKEQPVKSELAPVTISKPLPREIRDWDIYTGLVISKEEPKVRAQVTGTVESVDFVEGTEVKEGKVLFEIDPNTYKAVLKQAEGQLKLRKAEKEAADKDFVRVEKLFKGKNISELEFDEAYARKEKSAAAVLAAQGDVDRAAVNLKYCTITAPISGKVGKALVTKGNLVSQAGVTVMTTIVQMDPIYVEFGVDERALLDYTKKSKGDDNPSESIEKLKIPVELGRSVDEGFPYKGFLDFADNQVDPATGTILVRAKLANPNRKLIPGLFAKVRIATTEPYKALLVSDRAVLQDQSVKYLLVAKKDGDKYKVQRKDVKIGELIEGGLRVIQAGISENDLVIVNGVQFARPEGFVQATVEDMPVLPGTKED